MKPNNVIKGIKGVNHVEEIVTQHWSSDWQKVDAENDDAIDGIILLRKKGEITGEVIYVQVKTGNGYLIKYANSSFFGIKLGEKHINDHRPRWNKLLGPVILIYVDNEKKSWWVDLKDANSYSNTNKSAILIPNTQTFGGHSKGMFKKISNLFPQDTVLKEVQLDKDEKGYMKINQPPKFEARKFYKYWASLPISERTNPGLGEIIVNRVGWRHLCKKNKTGSRILSSMTLLGAAKNIIKNVEKAYQIEQSEINNHTNNEIIYLDTISIRAKVRFNAKNSKIVQVILKRKRVLNIIDGIKEQKVWFYSVFELRS